MAISPATNQITEGEHPMKRPRSIVASVGACLAALGLAVLAVVATPTSAGAQSGGFQRGPNPTSSTLQGRGPFATTQVDVSGAGQGYNNVTICYPNDTSQGTFGGVVVMPGFVSFKSQMMWSCQKIASHGFVVAVAETNTIFDFPGQRADQQQAIIRHISGSGAPAAVAQRLDESRWAAAGWSMGGGGSLDAGVRNNPQLQAVVGWEPWNISSYGGLRVPALIVGAQNDFIASAGGHAEPFYQSITQTEKYYVELAGQGHFVGSTDNVIQSASTIAWLKRWVDNDTRYDQFLCPPAANPGIVETRSSCPMAGT
jgi:dienelactone hydrolase